MQHSFSASVDYALYSHPGGVQSVVFHERFFPILMTPNDSYRTFTFDLDQGRLLSLADLFAPGVDPLVTIPPIARPYLVDALMQAQPPHTPDVYPFIPEKWEPQPDGSGFSGNYRAFALTADELILYLPDAQMMRENPAPPKQWQWSMAGGTVILHLPLSALRPILAPRFGG